LGYQNDLKEIILAKNEAESESKMKSEFLANMSHDLRTPLHSILILAENLAEDIEGNLTEKQLKSAQIIYNSGSDLLEKINDMLDISKIETGKMEITIDRINIHSFVNNLKMRFSDIANRHEINLDIKSSPEIPEYIHSDRTKLEQIIRILLLNSIKYSNKGNITLKFFILGDDSKIHSGRSVNEQFIGISVQDVGAGLTQDKQEKILNFFSKIDGTSVRKYEVIGLGLSLVGCLTHLLGGKIHLNSELNVGSEFTIFIPTNRENNDSKNIEICSEDAVSDEYEQKVSSFEGKKALIVDDEERNIFALHEILSERKINIISAENGEEALEILDENPDTDIIFMDIMMPFMSGIDAARCIRRKSQFKNTPIIALTANVIKRGDKKYIEAGIDDQLSKPLKKNNLDRMLIKWLDK